MFRDSHNDKALKCKCSVKDASTVVETVRYALRMRKKFRYLMAVSISTCAFAL